MFLCVRLGSGAVGILPAVAFVASAIVQTHVGFTPAALYLVATGALFCFRELFVVAASVRRRSIDVASRVSLGAAAVVSILLWALPLYEDLSRPAGNLHLLRVFFSLPHPTEHSWQVAIDVVSGQLAIFPLALCHALGRASMDVGMTGRHLLAGGQAAAVAAGLVIAWRRRDQPAALLSAICARAVRRRHLRGARDPRRDLRSPHRLDLGAGFHRLGGRRDGAGPGGRRRSAAHASACWLVGLPLLALALRAGGDKPMVRDRDVPLETLTADVETFLHRAGIDHLRLEIPAHDEWPRAAGLIVTLAKHGFDVTVTDDWLFMFGTPARSAGTEQLPGAGRRRRRDRRRSFASGPAYELIATADGTSLFLRRGPER